MIEVYYSLGRWWFFDIELLGQLVVAGLFVMLVGLLSTGGRHE